MPSEKLQSTEFVFLISGAAVCTLLLLLGRLPGLPAAAAGPNSLVLGVAAAALNLRGWALLIGVIAGYPTGSSLFRAVLALMALSFKVPLYLAIAAGVILHRSDIVLGVCGGIICYLLSGSFVLILVTVWRRTARN